jgi:lipid-binding SYLF domain-containing protein
MKPGATGMSGVLDLLSKLALVTVIVKKAQIALDATTNSEALGPDLRSWFLKSRGLFVAPDVLPGALIPGGGCSGLFVARTPDGRDWNGPAFHLVGGVALGRQHAGASSTLFLLAMTERGVNAFLSDSIGLRGEAHVEAVDTAGNGADIVGFALSGAALLRLSLDQVVVTVCDGLNHAVYGLDVTPADIIIRGARGPNPSGLRRPLIGAAERLTTSASVEVRSSADAVGRAAHPGSIGAPLRSTGGGGIG